MRSRLCLVLVGFFCSLSVPSAIARTWTDSSGTRTVEAELVRVEGDTVYLKKTNDKVIGVPLTQLSEADRQFVQERRKLADEMWRSLVKSMRGEKTVVTPSLPYPPTTSPPSRPATYPSSRSVAGPQLTAVTAAADNQQGQRALKIEPASNVDEKLFLLRMLDDLYRQLPSPDTEAKALQTKLGELRYFAQKTQIYVKDQKRDDSLASLFGQYVEVVDAYSDFLSEIDKIQRGAVTKAEQDAAETGFSAGVRGGTAAALASNQGASDGEALCVGAMVGIFSALADSYRKDQEIQEVKRQEVEQAIRKLKDKFSALKARTELTAAELTRRNGWKKGEAGFDEEKEESELQRLLTLKDWAGAWSILLKQNERRPRDPFIKTLVVQISAAALEGQGKTSKMLDLAKECVESATLVPDGTLYDPYRLRFLLLAGGFASKTASAELRESGHFSGGRNATAAYAAQIWKACLNYSTDPTGEIRERHAFALGASGNLKDAAKLAQEVSELRGKTIRYAINFAGLQSQLGETDSAFYWFSKAVKTLGHNGISRSKRDPDLAAMRKARQKDFDDLVSVKWTWNIAFGMFNDDIIMQNNSAFTLTNVELSVKIVQGDKEWAPVLRVDSIAPGASYNWENAVSIPGGRVDNQKTKAALSCDQSK